MNSQSKKTQNHTLFISFSDLVGGRRGVDYKINIERIGGHGLSSLFFFVCHIFSFRLLGGINHQIKAFSVCQDTTAYLRQGQTCLRWKEVDGSRAISVLFDEATVVLCTGGRVHSSPAVLAVVAEAVDVAAEVGGVAIAAVHTMALITHLVVQHIWLHFHLRVENMT